MSVPVCGAPFEEFTERSVNWSGGRSYMPGESGGAPLDLLSSVEILTFQRVLDFTFFLKLKLYIFFLIYKFQPCYYGLLISPLVSSHISFFLTLTPRPQDEEKQQGVFKQTMLKTFRTFKLYKMCLLF